MLVGVAAAWALAVAAELTGVAGSLHHASLVEGGFGFGVGLLQFLLAWQVMVAAMMMPASLPLVGMYARIRAGANDRCSCLVAFVGAYALVWSVFGAIAFLGDAGLHAAVAASPWLSDHGGVIGSSVLLLAGGLSDVLCEVGVTDTAV
jgi:predicted metal-binding membrane protein